MIRLLIIEFQSFYIFRFVFVCKRYYCHGTMLCLPCLLTLLCPIKVINLVIQFLKYFLESRACHMLIVIGQDLHKLILLTNSTYRIRKLDIYIYIIPMQTYLVITIYVRVIVIYLLKFVQIQHKRYIIILLIAKNNKSMFMICEPTDFGYLQYYNQQRLYKHRRLQRMEFPTLCKYKCSVMRGSSSMEMNGEVYPAIVKY